MLVPFGVLETGESVHAITLTQGRMTANILTYGATIRDLRYEQRRVVRGLPTLAAYETQKAYLGAIVGRYANRIRQGRFSLDGVDYQLACNNPPNHLHGGSVGFDRRVWQVAEHGPTMVTLTLTSPAGEEGYPGTVEVRCVYQLLDTGLRITLNATTDQTTLMNLAAHSYFNLSGQPTIDDHRLTVAAERYLPIDDTAIPTGEPRPVDATDFDLRGGRRLADIIHRPLDHNFIVGPAPLATPRCVAHVSEPHSGLNLEVWSTEPGLQVYDGAWLVVASDDLDGRAIVRNGGLCLEPQRFPDSPNRPDFPSAVLRPGETYQQITEYRFHTPFFI